MGKKISIIIPVFNSEEYINNCLDSVINQTYRNIEIIIINDGSTDNSERIIKEYSSIDSRIKYYKKSNGGVSSARNYGIKKSRGDYIFFLDSDDQIQDNALEIMLEMLLKKKNSISICKFSKYDGSPFCDLDSNFTIYNKNEYLLNLLNLNFHSYVCGVLIPKKYLDENFFPLDRYFEDLASFYKILDKVDNVVVTDSKLYKYRYNPNSIVNNINSKKISDYKLSVSEFVKYAAKYSAKEFVNIFVCESLIELYIFSSEKRIISEYRKAYINRNTSKCTFKVKFKQFLFNYSKVFRLYLVKKNNKRRV